MPSHAAPAAESGRVALVTGAARGIGAATARALVADGYQVVAVDRCEDDPALPYHLGSREGLQAVRDAAPPGRILTVEADVRDRRALNDAVALAERTFGGLDVVVAVAGVIAGGVPLWEMPVDQVDAVLNIDLVGVVNIAMAAIPALLRRPIPRSGRFLAVASAASTRGLPMLAAYCAAKAGVTGLIRGLAGDLRGTGVTANAVSPGSTGTAILDESARLYALASAGDFAGQQVIERIIDPAEIAAALVWLAGPANSAMTGANVAVDGGLAL